MQYSVSNTIQKPLEAVIQKFKEPNGALHWMEGVPKIEHLSGIPGEVGAKSDFHFLHKNKAMKISEEILEQNLPSQIKFAYQSPMGRNTVEMLFETLPDGNVKQSNNTSFELKGAMKLFGFLMKGMFKKQSLKYMDGFKAYAEKG